MSHPTKADARPARLRAMSGSSHSPPGDTSVIDVVPAPTSARVATAPTVGIADATVPLPTLLHALTSTYAAGDAPLGEQLLLQALDEQLPWDMVCTAAAQGIAAHRAEQSRA